MNLAKAMIIHKAAARFSPLQAMAFPASSTLLALGAILNASGSKIDWQFVGMAAAACIVVWFPLALIIAYLNCPEVIAQDDALLVRPSHGMVAGRRVPYAQCRWWIDPAGRLVLEMFPLTSLLKPASPYLPRIRLALNEEARQGWVQTLTEKGAVWKQ